MGLVMSPTSAQTTNRYATLNKMASECHEGTIDSAHLTLQGQFSVKNGQGMQQLLMRSDNNGQKLQRLLNVTAK